ncbi:hypothetical protein BBJ28_00007277 [Nothophytophthora sp. Chile5]|nr:hypothetical protein BBJ28_00007277 [Nothophytophthora sp. Chile5]
MRIRNLLLWRVAPVCALALSVRYSWATMLAVRAAWWVATGVLQILVLLVGSGSFWWVLRSYQLQKEQELFDQALLKYRFYSRCRYRSGSGTTTIGSGSSSFNSGDYASFPAMSGNAGGCMTDAGFQLRVLKRLPIVAHLRTSWSLPPEICDEIAAFVRQIVQDYVSFWFQAVSPNEDFPNDVKFLLADILGAVASRVLEIDSSQALTMVAKSLELLRLHLGWFREAYAQLAEEYPSVFEGDENDANLLKRQEYVMAFVQRSQFVHPGCVVAAASSSPQGAVTPSASGGGSSSKKNGSDNAEAVYLRHVATQLLIQLKPQLGQQYDSNVFVSIAMNLLREVTAFKILKPLTEYSQPQYVNEIVLSCLRAFIDEKDATGPLSPTASPSGSGGGGGGMMPTLTLNKLRLTSSFLYKASKRSGEQAEAAFQAVVEAVASAASTAAAGAAEVVFEADDWTDSGNPFAFGSAVFAANSVRSTGEKKATSSLLAMDDRISMAKAARLINPRGLIPGGFLSHKSTGENGRTTTHMDDLKNAKNNIGSSLNSSLGKVKKRFRTLGSHQMDPLSTPPLSGGAAARMIRKPGQLLQKAWKRNESGSVSPSASFDDGSLTPPLEGARGRSNARAMGSLNPLLSPLGDEEEEISTPRTPRDSIKTATIRDRVVLHVEKAVANYMKMHDEHSEMRSSARSRELYELLSAIEDALMLGYRHYDSNAASSEEDNDDEDGGSATPPVSPMGRRRSSLPLTRNDLMSPRQNSMNLGDGSESDGNADDDQYYWAYLAQDRPEALALNAHWRFVVSRCPECTASESFVSTRGIQWMLVALEKGVLGDLCAELHEHDQVTELFYESHAVLRNAELMGVMLTNLSKLDKLRVCLDVPTLLGRQNDVDGGISASPSIQRRSRDVGSPSSTVRVLERVWETEHYVPIQGWVKANDKRWQELPSSEWMWEGDWTMESAGNDTGGSSDSESANATWEYAKTFEDHFHEKEKKFDSVRRRRWIRRRRQLPPVLTLARSPMSPTSSFGVSSPTAASVPVGNGLGKARKLKQQFRALKRDKKKGNATDKGSVKKPLLKKRSKSFDKEVADSPIPDLTMSMLSSDTDRTATMSKTTSALMKARASIPSLRRGSSHNKIAKATSDTQPLSTGSSLDGDAVCGYDEDADDDDNLCFRCLKALPASKSGVGSCQSCHQRVCTSCHDFFAFMVFPPPLDSSKKARVCGNCYDRLVSKYKLRIEAHVGKYLIKERERDLADLFGGGASSGNSSNTGSNLHNAPTSASGSSPGSGGDAGVSGATASVSSPSGSRATGSTKFEITVKVKDESAYAWSVIKTFHDFETLEKQLHGKRKLQEKKCGAGCRCCHWKGVDYMEMTAIRPSLKTSATLSLPYEKRLHVLEEFLQQLLACDTLCQSPAVQKFLLLANAYGSSLTPGNAPLFGWEGGEFPTSPSVTSPSGGGVSSSGNGAGLGGSGGLLMENGKWRKGRWVAPDANSKETKMRVLQKIEVSLFAVLGEVFEFDGIGMVRRQIFAMTRSFIKAFLGASHFRMLERQFLSFTDPRKLSAWIGDLRAFIFPDSPSEIVAAPLSASDMQALRKDCLEAILASFPSKAVSLFGDTSCQNAALKLHEFLQHEVFVKNLLFSITDELLLHLFPDSATFKPKKTPGTAAVKTAPTPSLEAAAASASATPAPAAPPKRSKAAI